MKLLTSLLFLMLLAVPALANENIVVVFDDSGSMTTDMGGKRRIDVAKNALLTVSKNLKDDTQIGIVCINGGWSLPLGPLNRQNFEQAVNRIGADGSTYLGKTMKTGADSLLQLRAKQAYGNYRLFILTDGEANDGAEVEKHNADIVSRGIRVDVIGIQMKQDHPLSKKVRSYRRGDDIASLEKGISEALGEVSATAGDTSDYELIAPLPDDVAKAVLKALTESANEPIGTRPSVRIDSSGNVVTDSSGMVPLGSASGGLSSGVAIGTIVVVVVVLIIVGIAVICKKKNDGYGY